MHRPSRSARVAGGFTLVELLVVIAIIGVLMALVMPAVNGAREAGRRTACSNNQFQQAFGLIRFNDSKRFIPGWRNAVTGTAGPQPYSWPVMILPTLERTDIYNVVASSTVASPGIYLSTFVCPSSPPDTLTSPVLAYAGSAGQASNAATLRGAGVMLDTAASGAMAFRVSMDDVANNDGTASTLILSEKCMTGTIGLNQATWDVRPAVTGTFTFQATSPIPAFGIIGTTMPTKVINSTTLGSATVPGQVSQPSSNHPGGVVAAFCDGRVQFIKDSLPYYVYAQLMSWSNAASDVTGTPYARWIALPASGKYSILQENDFN